MRAIFATDALQDAAAWRHLDLVLYKIEDGWHEWQIDDPEPLESSPYLKGSNRPSLRKLFEEASVRSTYPRNGSLHQWAWTISNVPAAGSLAPAAAAAFFTAPLKVLVENRFTDGLLLDTVLDFLAPDELQDFLRGCQDKPFTYDSGGGAGELPKLIEDHARQNANRGCPPRAVVFADSDARFPAERSKQASAVAQACMDHGIDCLILKKRTIENYIPDEILLAWAREASNTAALPRVEALCRLSTEQRDHLALKKRFPANWETEQERQLFASVPDADRALLQQRGFNEPIELLDTHKAALCADALRRRDHGGDLGRLVTMLLEAL